MNFLLLSTVVEKYICMNCHSEIINQVNFYTNILDNSVMLHTTLSKLFVYILVSMAKIERLHPAGDKAGQKSREQSANCQKP